MSYPIGVEWNRDAIIAVEKRHDDQLEVLRERVNLLEQRLAALEPQDIPVTVTNHVGTIQGLPWTVTATGWDEDAEPAS